MSGPQPQSTKVNVWPSCRLIYQSTRHLARYRRPLTVDRYRSLPMGSRPARRHNAGMDLRDTLTGAVVMGPMTKGSNLPYRRLCVELGARVTVSEMTVAR